MVNKIVISGNILGLVVALEKEGHTISVGKHDDCGNSHTSIELDVNVRSPKEKGAIARITYKCTSSYGFGYVFKRRAVTPAFTSKEISLNDFILELGVKGVVADANAVRDKHLSLKGVEYVDRALRAVEETHLAESMVNRVGT